MQGGLVKRNGVWNLVFTDNNYETFKYINGEHHLDVSITILSMKKDVCCRLIGEPACNCPSDVQVSRHFLPCIIFLDSKDSRALFAPSHVSRYFRITLKD